MKELLNSEFVSDIVKDLNLDMSEADMQNIMSGLGGDEAAKKKKEEEEKKK